MLAPLTFGGNVLKNLTLRAAAAVALLARSLSAHAQQAASATANASATLIQPISVAKNKDRAFETLVKPATGSGTLTISNAGVRSVANGVQARLDHTVPGAVHHQRRGRPVDRGHRSGVRHVRQRDELAHRGLEQRPERLRIESQVLSGSIGSSGTLTVNVGGSVALPSTETTGVYSGSLTVATSCD